MRSLMRHVISDQGLNITHDLYVAAERRAGGVWRRLIYGCGLSGEDEGDCEEALSEISVDPEAQNGEFVADSGLHLDPFNLHGIRSVPPVRRWSAGRRGWRKILRTDHACVSRACVSINASIVQSRP